MLTDYELRSLVKEVAVSVEAASLAAQILNKGNADRQTDEEIQILMAFLEKASEDLEKALGRQELPFQENSFPSKALALHAIEKLPVTEGLGFQIKVDGLGHWQVRIWFTDDETSKPDAGSPN